MRRVLKFPLLTFAVMLGLASPSGAQEALSVRLDFSPWGSHAAMHLAKHNGWFEEAGLKVDIQDGRGSGNTLQLVNAGQVDVGQVQLGLIPAARQNKANVKSFAGFVRRTDLCVLVDKDAPIDKIADFKGKKLVVFAASPWVPYIDGFLAAGGLDRNTTTVEFVDAAALFGTYSAKRVDGLMATVSSAWPVVEAARPSKCLTSDLADLYYPSYGLIASEATLRNRREALTKLVAIQQRAWAELARNPDAGVEAMMAERPNAMLNPDVVREQIKLTIEYLNTPATEGKPIGWQAPADWEAALKGMERVGVVPAGWKVEDYFTNDLIPQ